MQKMENQTELCLYVYTDAHKDIFSVYMQSEKIGERESEVDREEEERKSDFRRQGIYLPN